MTQSYAWIILIIMLHTQSTFNCYTNNEEPIQALAISRGTHLTFRRYYFISRLDKTMHLLLKIQSSHNLSFSRSLRSIKFDITLFNDKRIIRSLKRIQETRTLKPLFMIWDDFIAYKSLEDDVFIEDFSKEIFVVTRTVLSCLDEHCVDNTLCLESLTQEPARKTEFLLDAIDEITYSLQKMMPLNPPHYKSSAHPLSLDLKSEVTTDEIALRYYYIQRLNKAIQTIQIMQNTSPYQPLEHKTIWKSPHINALLRAMQETGSNQPVINVWNDIKEYKFIDNLEFVKDFAGIILLTLQHLYAGATPTQLVTHTESHLEKMDIEDLLHAIDIINDQISHNAQSYNEYSAVNFRDWLQHYWWVPPVTIASIIIRYVHYCYTRK